MFQIKPDDTETCMYKTPFFLALSCACLTIAACSDVSTRTDALAGSGQSVEYVQGAAFLHSQGREAVVSASSVTNSDTTRVLIAIANVCDHDLQFSETLITASENGQSVQVVTAAELEHQAERRDMWRRIAIGAAGGLNAGAAANAGRSTFSGDFSAYNSYGTTVNGSYTGTYNDPAVSQAAVERANAQTAAALEQANAVHAQELQAIQGELQRTTIHPGQSIRGWITLGVARNRGKENQIELKISLGDEVHALHFVETRG